MALQCGIVGLPNVGKSSLFNALTESSVPAENYPFCTIDPHLGIVELPDQRLIELNSIYNPKKLTSATVEFTDIAGLVKGASAGEGLANQFLGHIRETSAIIHVVRCFEDNNVIHVEGKISPIDDLETIETELVLSDLEIVEKRIEKVGKQLRNGDKALEDEYEYLEKIKKELSDKGFNADLSSNSDEDFLKNLQLIVSKSFFLYCKSP